MSQSERVTGIEPSMSALRIDQILANEDAEQPTLETRSNRE